MRTVIGIAIVCGICLVCAPFACAQSGDTMTGAPADVMAASREARETVTEPQDVIIYGEVQTVDPASGKMSVLYYDYDSDEEKVVELLVSGDAAIENAEGLAGIQKGDWADITFLTGENGANRVSSIIVEREEEEPAEAMYEEETTE